MEIKYVESHTIFLTVVGSRAYGTYNDNTSDWDKAGVMIPGKEYFYGLDRFDQFSGYPEEDRTIYDIRKAVKLIADNNPNVLDLLAVPDRCILKTTPYWDIFRENSHLFISKRCRWTFAGYAASQINRLITHRAFILNPPKEEPTRAKYGLKDYSIFPTAQLKAVVYAALGDIIISEEKENFLAELDDVYSDYIMVLFNRYIQKDKLSLAMEYLQAGIKSQANTLKALGPAYVKDEYLEEATKELQYYQARKEWDQYQEWKKHRNKARAELEEKYGFDCKFAMHGLRLSKMCVEILKTSKINVDRTGIDAEELKAIRNGAWSFEKIQQAVNDLDKEAEELYKTSTLQKIPDRKKINEILIDVCDRYLNKERS
jgi:predicted nucleotidyltransferase